MKMKLVLLLVMCGLLSACGKPMAATPAPTPQAVDVFFPAALQPWADRLSMCASGNPGVGLYFFERTTPNPSIKPNEIYLVMGQPAGDGPGSEFYQVGVEQVVVIVNQDNPVEGITDGMLLEIFSGQAVNWQNGLGQPIQVWVLPDGEPAHQVFDSALALTGTLAPGAKLAPDPMAILMEVAKDKNAIGYLPQGFINAQDVPEADQIKIVQLDPSLVQALLQPVIAITGGEAKGMVRSLLSCLQTTSR
jgi:hypothetical protein